MNNSQYTLSKYLQMKREASGLTQAQVAKALKYSWAQYVSNWERGACPPPMSKLSELAKIYKLNPAEFMDVIINETIQELESQFKLSYRTKKKYSRQRTA